MVLDKSAGNRLCNFAKIIFPFFVCFVLLFCLFVVVVVCLFVFCSCLYRWSEYLGAKDGGCRQVDCMAMRRLQHQGSLQDVCGV